MIADPETIISKLTDSKIIQQTSSDVDESRNARQDREADWRSSADLYNNIGDDSGKAPWQARVFIPQIHAKIEMARIARQVVAAAEPQLVHAREAARLDRPRPPMSNSSSTSAASSSTWPTSSTST